MENNLKFGETLRRLRRSKLLSQQELADRYGKSRNRISDFERGFSQPSSSTFVKIAETLGLLPSELLEECKITQQKYLKNSTEKIDETIGSQSMNIGGNQQKKRGMNVVKRRTTQLRWTAPPKPASWRSV